MLFDSHAHYDDEQFDEDKEVKNGGITRIINVASSIESSYECLKLSDKYDFIYASVGVHPHVAESMDNDAVDVLREISKHDKAVAIGEIGLDYYYDNSPREVQKFWYDRQLTLAEDLNMPVIIHDREAHHDIIKQHSGIRGVMHCFSGSREMAQELVKMGFYISFSGSVTFKNARKIVEAAAVVPDDRLLIETDCPYLAPVPHRGERNSSLFMPDTARQLAAIRGDSFEHLCEITYSNACKLFGID